MARPPIKKPTVKAPVEATETPAVETTPTGRNRKAVLVEYTPNELAALVGGDTKVLVGRKGIDAVRLAKLKAENGL